MFLLYLEGSPIVKFPPFDHNNLVHEWRPWHQELVTPMDFENLLTSVLGPERAGNMIDEGVSREGLQNFRFMIG